MSGKLAALPLKDYARLAGQLAEKDTEDSILLTDMLDEYELRTAPHLEERKQAIIIITADADPDLEALCRNIEEWGGLIWPSLLTARRRGQKTLRFIQNGNAILEAVRSLALSLHNKHNRTEDAFRLTLAMKESLADVSETFQRTLEEDIKILSSIIRKKREKEKQEAQEAAAIRRAKEAAEAQRRRREAEANEMMHRLSLLEDLKPQIVETSKYIQSNPDVDLEQGIGLLQALIEKWDALGQPLLRTARLHGPRYNKVRCEAEAIISAVRQLLLFLHYECSRTEEALQLALCLKKYFAWLPPHFTKVLEEDVKMLEALLQVKQEGRGMDVDYHYVAAREEEPKAWHGTFWTILLGLGLLGIIIVSLWFISK